jgi:hypothetical protein
MKAFKTLALLGAVALGITAQASAALYSITFTDGGANVGSGQIEVVGGYAVSGYFDVTSGAASGYVWALTGGTASYPNYLTSPQGASGMTTRCISLLIRSIPLLILS